MRLAIADRDQPPAVDAFLHEVLRNGVGAGQRQRLVVGPSGKFDGLIVGVALDADRLVRHLLLEHRGQLVEHLERLAAQLRFAGVEEDLIQHARHKAALVIADLGLRSIEALLQREFRLPQLVCLFGLQPGERLELLELVAQFGQLLDVPRGPLRERDRAPGPGQHHTHADHPCSPPAHALLPTSRLLVVSGLP